MARWGKRRWPVVSFRAAPAPRGGRRMRRMRGHRSAATRRPFRIGWPARLALVGLALTLAVTGAFLFIDRNIRPPLMTVASLRVKQVATQAINKAITEQVAAKSDFSKLVDWKTNGDGKIAGFMLNYGEHMQITSRTIETVQETLDHMKDIPERIPVGQAVGSAILSSFGPRVPVRFEPVGSVKADLGTRQKDAGINMILVEVYIRIEAEVAIIIPFDTKPETVQTEIPISYLLVVGDVPMYYYDSKGNPVSEGAPNISLPLQSGTNGEEDGAGTETPLPPGDGAVNGAVDGGNAIAPHAPGTGAPGTATDGGGADGG